MSYKYLLSGLIASGLNYKTKCRGCGCFAKPLGESLIVEQNWWENEVINGGKYDKNI